MITVYGCGGALVSGTIPPTVLRHTARTAGVMVWGAIAYDSRSTLIVMCGTLKANVTLMIFFDPNKSSSRLSTSFSDSSMASPLPPICPPVEHVWDQLKQQMPSYHSVHDLELAFQDLWAHLPQDNTRCLINSMPDRVAACIAAGGGPMRY
ncbi:uncharacterized protein TNCV_2703071 [Trichonephila clavipes]|nr:uncharacterized protein TNCV_2703071 [Trichonephila clavipes]